MEAIRVALVQLAWSGSRDSMMAQYRTLIAQAAAQGAALVCLPEFSLLPYFPGTRDARGFDWAEPLPGGLSEQFFGEMARTHGVTLVGSLFEKTLDGQYFDTATVHNPQGALAGITRKVHIPYGEGYNETDFFKGYDEYPVHTLQAVKIAAPTCYDQWFPELARIYALNGAEFIFYPTAIGSEPSDPHIDTQPMWETVMRGHAIANGLFIGAANRVGVENGVTFYGSSFVCDPTGRILAQAGRVSTEVICADLNPRVMQHWRDLFPLLKQRMPHTYGRILQGE
ncbi:MAG: hydrolase [Chloroflexi bacterium]|nr:hydrolase [Chloroflexota bacterium]